MSQGHRDATDTTHRMFAMVLSSTAFPRLGRATTTLRSLSLGLLLGMLAYPDHAFVMAFHAVNPVTGLGEDKFVDAILAHFALEAVGVIRVVASHDGLVEDRLLADIA